MAHQKGVYFIPHNSVWPIVAAVSLFTMLFGAAHWLNDSAGIGPPIFFCGLALVIFMFFGWFGSVIRESVHGNYNGQVDTSFRMGMMWFIFSEVMFFGAFFGALFYARIFSVPWLGGEGHGAFTNYFLWKGYTSSWPTNGPEGIGGAFQIMSPWGIPLINTLILLTSGVTITVAHHALKEGHQTRLLIFQALTVLLGAFFLYMQAHEYIEAYTHFNLTLHSGIYGTTFFMLTGFHGLHVTLGTIMLIVIWFRCKKGHFTKDNHFAFEAVAWYWHFVDVVWLALFLFVYIL
ncbi:cytochrome c oxidase subunit 3 [Oleiagrimonas sp. C23AA]|uniref:cytochrome c oxidase subunit 3 n=1 Tax=Oleiagrimonas sp. C23AA TaxID=2719047 RepID=UPI0014231E26|nr:cytochrome c oxidase subunit 3 [Oleiagrimonas sp. C23AA]NII11365.1 cytochrome c oxidase subunit 3 [Oleiagrimonas sp. C23AA]